MDPTRVLVLSIMALPAIVMFAEGAFKHENIPFLRRERERPCRPEWRPHKNLCYRIRRAPRLPHKDAQRACQLESSQSRLVALSDETKDFLSDQVQQDGINSVWVAGDRDNCTSLNKDGTVQDSTGCGELKGYVCSEMDKFSGCPEGQVGFGPFCFSESTVRSAWRAARLFCRLQGVRGDLASIHSQEQYDFIREQFGNGPNDKLWIGLHKESADSPYRWANGDKVQYLPWAPDYMGQESRGYVTMSLRDRQFQTQGLSDLAVPFLCSTVRVVDASTTIKDRIGDFKDGIRDEVDEVQEDLRVARQAASDAARAVFSFPFDIADDVIDAAQDIAEEVIDAAGDVGELFFACDRFWLPYGNMCYRAFFELVSFNQAQESCREKGGDLVTFLNLFQSDFVRTEVIKQRPNDSYWIGLSNGRKGLQWSDGSPLVYMNWNAKESNVLQLSTFRGCFEINGFLFRWTPRDCEINLFYVCQKPQDEDTRSKMSVKAAGSSRNATDVAAPSAENGESSGASPELRLSADEKALWDTAARKQRGTQKAASHDTTVLFGLMGAAVAVAAVAFGLVTWRRRSARNQHYAFKPARRSGSRSNKRNSVGVSLGHVLQSEESMEAARVTDPQKTGYGTME